MDEHVLVIEAGRSEQQYFKDLWRYRELFVFLAWRDILVRYKQTIFGVLWAILRPVLTMVVFTVVFGKIAKMPSGGVPYPIFVYVAMLPWQFFASSFSESGNSLTSNSNLLTKIYFPRIIMPASSIIVALIDFLVALVVLVGLMLYYGVAPAWTTLMIPIFILMTFLMALGGGLLVAVSVKYRDLKHIVPFVLQFGLYLSPVGFSSQVVPEQWRVWYCLNPMVGIIDGFRWAILGQPLNVMALVSSICVSVLLIVIGFRYFRNTERTFADDI